MRPMRPISIASWITNGSAGGAGNADGREWIDHFFRGKGAGHSNGWVTKHHFLHGGSRPLKWLDDKTPLSLRKKKLKSDQSVPKRILPMACDHLIIRVELSAPVHGHCVRQFCLYSPSTVLTLCKELSETLSLPATAFSVSYQGKVLSDTTRVVDKQTYQVRLLEKVGVGTGTGTGTGVSLGEGVVCGPSVILEDMEPVPPSPKTIFLPAGPKVSEEQVYVAFYHRSMVRLVDVSRSVVLLPNTTHCLGRATVYYDEGFFRRMWLSLPSVDKRVWMYDRLRRDFGIPPTSSLFTIETAPLATMESYHRLLEGYFLGVDGEEDEDEDEEGEGREDEEDEDEEGMGEIEDMDDMEGMEDWR